MIENYLVEPEEESPPKQKPEPHGFPGELYHTFKKELSPVLLNLFQKVEKEGILLNLLHKPALPWYQARKEQHKKRKITGQCP